MQCESVRTTESDRDHEKIGLTINFRSNSFHRFIMATTYDNIFSMIEKEARKKNCSFAIGRSHIVKLKAIFKEAFGKVFIKRIIFNF